MSGSGRAGCPIGGITYEGVDEEVDKSCVVRAFAVGGSCAGLKVILLFGSYMGL